MPERLGALGTVPRDLSYFAVLLAEMDESPTWLLDAADHASL